MKRKKTKKVKGSKTVAKKKKPAVVRDVSAKRMAELTGFTLRYISTLRKKGMPHKKAKNAKGGLPLIYYNYEECITWMAAHSILTKETKNKVGAEVAAGMAQKPPPNGDTGDGGPKLSQDLLNSVGLEGALERIKLQEYNASRVVLYKIKTTAPAAELAAAEKFHTKSVMVLRRTEAQVIVHKKITGELVEYQPMVDCWVRTCVAFKNSVLGIANSSIPRAMPLLVDKDKGAVQLAAIITEESRRALNTIPEDEIPEPDKRSRPNTQRGRSK